MLVNFNDLEMCLKGIIVKLLKCTFKLSKYLKKETKKAYFEQEISMVTNL